MMPHWNSIETDTRGGVPDDGMSRFRNDYDVTQAGGNPQKPNFENGNVAFSNRYQKKRLDEPVSTLFVSQRHRRRVAS